MYRWKTPVLGGLAFAAAALAYHTATALAVTLMWMPQPDWWWAPPRVSLVLASLSWMHATQGIGLAAASLPFALALRLVPLRRPVALAFAMAFAALLAPSLWLLASSLPGMRPLVLASTALDCAKFIGMLPLLTWLMLQARPRQPRPPAPPARPAGALAT